MHNRREGVHEKEDEHERRREEHEERKREKKVPEHEIAPRMKERECVRKREPSEMSAHARKRELNSDKARSRS